MLFFPMMERMLVFKSAWNLVKLDKAGGGDGDSGR